MKNSIWITWEKHMRTRTLAKSFSIKLFEVVSPGRFPIKHTRQLAKSIVILLKEKPKILMVQNPSIILCFFSIILKFFFRFKLVVDAHNEGIEPLNSSNKFKIRLTNTIIKNTDITIVTNKYLQAKVDQLGGFGIIIPDKLPEPINTQSSKDSLSSKFNLVLIATYAADEPIKEILQAASNLSQTLTLYVTGNENKLDKRFRETLSSNIKFTGFLHEKEYWSLIASAHATIDLSLKDNCLVCGAYESVAVNTPMILSDSMACRDYFYKGSVYTSADTGAIELAIKDMIANHENYKKDIAELQLEIKKNWQEYENTFLNKLNC